MKAVHTFLLLGAFTEVAVALFWRNNFYINMTLPWKKAQTYCRNNYVDLATTDVKLDLDQFKTEVAGYLDEWCWIGLSQESDETFFTKWSDGSPFQFAAWGANQPNYADPHRCVFIDKKGWFDHDCATNLKFYCYVWKPDMIVVQQKKTWDEALVHCRTFYTDLVIVNVKNDFFVVSNKSLPLDTSSFWTGLRSLDGTWYWTNKRPMYKYVPLPPCAPTPFGCGALNSQTNTLENRDCNEKMNFICYKE